MKLLWIIVALFLVQDQVPFKPKEQFEIDLDFKFKQRPPASSTSNVLNADQVAKPSALLPYLYLNVKVLHLQDTELRVRVENVHGNNILSRKAEVGMTTKLDLGFTDDIKDRVSSHEYVFYFLDKDRKPTSRILIHFDEDGTYLVNTEKRGKL
jgi:hypothetical protein